MDLRQMRYFLALAQERSFSRAALRLHMAQPPLTRQIRQLEDELGVTLFERTARGVDLTDAAKSLLGDVPNILNLAALAEERAIRTGKGLAGDLQIGVFGSGMLYAVPQLIGRFRALRPDVRVHLHNLTKDAQIQALREHRISVGFHRLPPSESDLIVRTVTHEPMYVGMHETHWLSGQNEVSVDDLHEVPMILYPNTSGAGLSQEVAQAFLRENVAMNVAQRVDDFTTCISLVAAQLGVCITTESGSMLRLPGVTYRPLKSKYLKDIALNCVYRRGDQSATLSAFLNVVENYSESIIDRRS